MGPSNIEAADIIGALIMKKSHKLILILVAVYFCLAHVTSRIEISALQDKSTRLEDLLLQSARQQQQILLNQERSRQGQANEPWHPDTDQIPDLV